MKNLILFFFAAVLFSSCMTQGAKHTLYSSNSPEGQSWEKYKNGNSCLVIKNKTKEDQVITVFNVCADTVVFSGMVPARKGWLRAGKKKVSVSRNIHSVNDHKNAAIKIDVVPYFEYVTKLTPKNSVPKTR